jgi:hypothetical protein
VYLFILFLTAFHTFRLNTDITWLKADDSDMTYVFLSIWQQYI